MNTTNPTIAARIRRTAIAGLAAAALATTGIGLAGCAASTEAPANDEAVSTDLASVQHAGPFTITDAWVKATDTMMTGAFGEFENTSDEDVVIEGVTATVGSMFELHETIVQSDGSSVMQEKEGGFTVAAGETMVLEPGHDHIMLMQLDDPIMPGDEITITLQLAGGETADFVVIAKEYTGAMETYAPDGSLGGHQHGGGEGDMDHDHDHEQMHQDTEESDDQ